MEYLFDRCSGEEVEVHAEIARRIWFRRNSVVHDGEFIHPNEIMKISDFDSVLKTRAGTAIVRWVPPPSSFFKINCDVALDNKNGRMGIGLLIRDSKGKVYATASQVVDFIVDPVVGESIAALKVVEFCKNRGLDRIMVEGDSLQVVHSINKPGLNWGKYGHIVADIHEVLRFFRAWKVCHTPREANSAAHMLAKEGIQFVADRVWLDCYPNSIREIVISELLTLVLYEFYALVVYPFYE
jgi:ribonuclease HI